MHYIFGFKYILGISDREAGLKRIDFNWLLHNRPVLSFIQGLLFGCAALHHNLSAVQPNVEKKKTQQQ